MAFVVQWLCYLAAFVVGSLLAWLVGGLAVRAKAEAHMLAGTDEPEPR